MKNRLWWVWLLSWAAAVAAASAATAARSFTVATYNLENYLLEPSGTRSAKSLAAREQVVRELLAIRPDVLAVQEIGPPPALVELQQRLRTAGLELPHLEHVRGWDTNIFVAVLSRFPFSARRSHSNDSFLLEGRRFQMGRGIVEVDLAVTPQTRFTLLAAHLKSKLPSARVDESTLREAEALVLRGHVEAAFRRDPKASLVVCGDLNDHKGSRPMRLLLAKGRSSLVDPRPGERSVDSPDTPRSGSNARRIVWTHFYAQEDTYARFDYLLLSPAMKTRWRPSGSYVHSSVNWGLASDHRPVVCEFTITE